MIINNRVKLLAALFLTFMKMGPVSFGGGYALIPVIERDIVEKRKWLKSEEIADIFAVSGSVPGAIAINSATFIGYRIAGVLGAVIAMLGILLPTFCLVLGLSIVYLNMNEYPKVEAAFQSIRATIVALIVYAAYKIGKTAIVDMTTAVMALLTAALLCWGGGVIHPVLLIAGGAVAGIVIISIRGYFGIKTKERKEEEEPVYDYMI